MKNKVSLNKLVIMYQETKNEDLLKEIIIRTKPIYERNLKDLFNDNLMLKEELTEMTFSGTFLKAINNFDINKATKNNQFYNYLNKIVYQYLQNYYDTFQYRENTYFVRTELHLSNIDYMSEDLIDSINNSLFISEIFDTILDETERKVLEKICLENLKIKEIAIELNTFPFNVTRIYNKALNKIRTKILSDSKMKFYMEEYLK